MADVMRQIVAQMGGKNPIRQAVTTREQDIHWVQTTLLMDPLDIKAKIIPSMTAASLLLWVLKNEKNEAKFFELIITRQRPEAARKKPTHESDGVRTLLDRLNHLNGAAVLSAGPEELPF